MNKNRKYITDYNDNPVRCACIECDKLATRFVKAPTDFYGYLPCCDNEEHASGLGSGWVGTESAPEYETPKS